MAGAAEDFGKFFKIASHLFNILTGILLWVFGSNLIFDVIISVE